MKQKVNPISMRLQVNKDWRSRWFVNKRDYAAYLKDDLEVRRLEVMVDHRDGREAAGANALQDSLEHLTSDLGVEAHRAREREGDDRRRLSRPFQGRSSNTDSSVRLLRRRRPGRFREAASAK